MLQLVAPAIRQSLEWEVAGGKTVGGNFFLPPTHTLTDTQLVSCTFFSSTTRKITTNQQLNLHVSFDCSFSLLCHFSLDRFPPSHRFRRILTIFFSVSFHKGKLTSFSFLSPPLWKCNFFPRCCSTGKNCLGVGAGGWSSTSNPFAGWFHTLNHRDFPPNYRYSHQLTKSARLLKTAAMCGGSYTLKHTHTLAEYY